MYKCRTARQMIACALLVLAMPRGASASVGGAGASSHPALVPGPLTLVSHGLPFHRGPCAARTIANRDSAAEPTIVSDPRHPERLLTAWFAGPDYDRLDHAGLVNLVSRSDDGGAAVAPSIDPGSFPVYGWQGSQGRRPGARLGDRREQLPADHARRARERCSRDAPRPISLRPEREHRVRPRLLARAPRL